MEAARVNGQAACWAALYTDGQGTLLAQELRYAGNARDDVPPAAAPADGRGGDGQLLAANYLTGGLMNVAYALQASSSVQCTAWNETTLRFEPDGTPPKGGSSAGGAAVACKPGLVAGASHAGCCCPLPAAEPSEFLDLPPEAAYKAGIFGLSGLLLGAVCFGVVLGAPCPCPSPHPPATDPGPSRPLLPPAPTGPGRPAVCSGRLCGYCARAAHWRWGRAGASSGGRRPTGPVPAGGAAGCGGLLEQQRSVDPRDGDEASDEWAWGQEAAACGLEGARVQDCRREVPLCQLA